MVYNNIWWHLQNQIHSKWSICQFQSAIWILNTRMYKYSAWFFCFVFDHKHFIRSRSKCFIAIYFSSTCYLHLRGFQSCYFVMRSCQDNGLDCYDLKKKKKSNNKWSISYVNWKWYNFINSLIGISKLINYANIVATIHTFLLCYSQRAMNRRVQQNNYTKFYVLVAFISWTIVNFT